MRTLCCVMCHDNTSVEIAHINHATYWCHPRGMGAKTNLFVPMCSQCHRGQHRGNETRWWENAGVRPHDVFARLLVIYTFCNGDPEYAYQVIRRARQC